MDVKDYLQQVYILEASCYEQELVIQDLQGRIDWLNSFRPKVRMVSTYKKSDDVIFTLVSIAFCLLFIGIGIFCIQISFLFLIGLAVIIVAGFVTI